MKENTLTLPVSCTCLNIYMPVWTVCFHQGCLFFSQLTLFSAKFIFIFLFFWSDRLSLVGVLSYCLVWQARSCFPLHLLRWPLTTHLSRRIFTWHFFSRSLVNSPFLAASITYSTPHSNVVSISSLYPFIFCQFLISSYFTFLSLVSSSLFTHEALLLIVCFSVSHPFLLP